MFHCAGMWCCCCVAAAFVVQPRGIQRLCACVSANAHKQICSVHCVKAKHT